MRGSYSTGNCNFEDFKMCTYLQDQTEDDFDWLRGHGSTSSWRTGPSTDNTKKDASGHYMYIEASLPRRRGDKARLVSEYFPPTGFRGRCVKFAFHMYGVAMGTLNLYVKTGAGNQSETLIWSNSGDHGNIWFPTAQAPIVSSRPYAVSPFSFFSSFVCFVFVMFTCIYFVLILCLLAA